MRDFPIDNCAKPCSTGYPTLREKLTSEICYLTESIRAQNARLKEAKSVLARLSKNRDLEEIVGFLRER